MPKLLLICALATGFLCACASGEQPRAETGQTAASVERAVPAIPVEVEPTKRTPIKGPLPKLSIKAPKGGVTLAKDVLLKVSVKNWKLAPAPGKHLHLIIDNEPYIAIRDVSKPLNVSALAREALGKELTPGTHIVRMFPSRPTHESVKRGSPFVIQVIHIDAPSSTFMFNPNAPLLTYSRPKGCAPVGEPLLLDFYVSNTTLGPSASKVRLTVDNVKVADLTHWSPHLIRNLTEGEHTIRLELIGSDGRPLPGPYNDTTRTIMIASHCD